jgi:septal ring-binding cell division protein DamX
MKQQFAVLAHCQAPARLDHRRGGFFAHQDRAVQPVPGRNAARSNTGTACSAPPVHTATVAIGGGSGPSRTGKGASPAVSPGSKASTIRLSITIARSGLVKPKRAWCAASNAARIATASPSATPSAVSVPA